jgi:atlastin
MFFKHCGGDRPYMHPHHLQAANTQIKDESIKKFVQARKMGGDSLSERYHKELEAEIEELYVNFVKHNESKNIFAFSRTATSLIAVMIISYLLSAVLEWLWLGSFSFLLNFLFWTCFVLLGSWVYVKYSGEYKEIGEYIDGFADILWRKVSWNDLDRDISLPLSTSFLNKDIPADLRALHPTCNKGHA